MIKKLQPLKNKLLLFFFFVLSLGAFGQTLVTYNFNDDLNPTGANAGLNPLSLGYYNSSNQGSTPLYYASRLRFRNSGDQVILKFNGTNFGGLNVSFTAWSGTFIGQINGDIKIYLTVGSGTEVLLDEHNFNQFAFGWDEENFSINIPTADYQSDVQIRIEGIINSSGGLVTGFGIDNLVLTSYSPKIQPYGYNNTNTLSQIAENAVASTAYGTDFGIVNTDDTANPNAATRVFRITNSGTASLQISGITFSGDNPGDFAWVTSPATPAPSTPAAVNAINSFPATINAGASRDFTVRFNPSADGKRSALLNISSNANPSPYSFYVEGRGSTCETTDLVLKSNTMEDSQTGSGVLTATAVGTSTMNFISGNSQPNAHDPLTGTRLYPHSNSTSNNTANTYNLYTSSSRSWYIRNDTSTVQFGPVDITNENGVYISFNLAAFSTATGTDFNNNDYVELQVLNPDTNDWSSELRIRGNNGTNQNANSRYSFDVGTTAETFYDGDDAAQVFTNGNNVGSKYSKVKLKLPGSANFQNLAFRIVAYNTSDQKLWLIDDVAVSSANVIQRKWNGTSWRDANNNAVTGPNETTKSYKNYKAVFEGNYNVPASGLTVCECEVNNNVNLTVPANRYLAVQTKITNLGNGDNFVVNSGGNLIQIEDNAINSGSITAERDVTDMDNVLGTQMDYVYWSAPVAGQDLRAFSPGTRTNKIFYYNEPNDLFKAVNFTTEPNFIPGKGYAFEAETTGVSSPSYDKTYKFKGVPNNGVINTNVQRSANTGSGGTVEHGYNLIGNPYPSNMSFPEFYAMNSGIIYNTAWFWTNNSYIPNQQGSGYNQNNYAVWTGTGGAPATTTSAADGLGDTFIPDGIVAVGQGFIVQVRPEYIGTGPQQLIFKNKNGSNMVRVSTTGHFFNKEGDQKDRFWLKLISSDSIVNTQLIGYIEGATNDFEKDYDAEIMGMSSNIFYSTLEDRKLQIQGKAAFNQEDKVQLGANIFADGAYTIALENPEGIFASGQNIYLKDHLMGTFTNLSEQDYTFDATAGITEGRFEIVYQPEATLATDQSSVKDDLLVYRNGTSYVVKSAIKNITEIEVYDVSGRLWKKLNTNSKEVTLDASALNSGMYILKINRNGEISGRKIMK